MYQDAHIVTCPSCGLRFASTIIGVVPSHHCVGDIQKDKKESEFRILEGTNAEVQKTVNQWKHQYTMKFISVTQTSMGYVTICLWRTTK